MTKLYLCSLKLPTIKNIADIPNIETFLSPYLITTRKKEADIFAGWGRRPSMSRALKSGKPILCLEDGFLRSVDFIQGQKNPPLSIVLDKTGIYFDSTKPSDLEKILTTKKFTKKETDRAKNCITKIQEYGLSKYNNGQAYTRKQLGIPAKKQCVLIVDQCYKDASITYGQADAKSFLTMIETARKNHPDALLLLKTHPDVLAGRRKGYLQRFYKQPNTFILTQNITPTSLFKLVDDVYVVSSLLGFEALCAGKNVHVFGQPFYAGWGACATELIFERRKGIKRSVEELFHAAYIDYSRYLDPYTGTLTDIETTIETLHKLRQQRFQTDINYHCLGFKRWKQSHILPFLAHTSGKIIFHKKPPVLGKNDRLVLWASKETPSLSKQYPTLLRMEDGFIRSVGLGSDLVKGMSLVLDKTGIYYDPNTASDLERILNKNDFSKDILKQAEEIKKTILSLKLSKYNADNSQLDKSAWPKNKEIIFVPGQVSNDASIRCGAIGEIKTNLDLLKEARKTNPKAYILYKPHPDVTSGNRIGYIPTHIAKNYVDEVITGVHIQDILPHIDAVHTITSLVGFEALLLGKSVHCYGMPFYAGWGLTHDSVTINRRKTRLNLNKLIAGALLCYPSYWDWTNSIPINAEQCLERLNNERKIFSYAGTKTLYKFLRQQGTRLWLNIKLTFQSYLNNSH